MKTNKQLKFITNLISIVLIQAFSLSNAYAFLPVERDNLSPDIEISTQLMQGVFSKAIELEQKTKIYEPLYTIDSLDELPFRLRSDKEMELLKLISLKNFHALNGLDDSEKKQFVILDVGLSDYILAKMHPDYKNKIALDDLYYQIVAIKVMIDSIINDTDEKIAINFVVTNVLEEKYTESIVVYKKKGGRRTLVSSFVEENLEADLRSETVTTFNAEEGLLNMDIGIIFMEIQKDGHAINIDEMSKIKLSKGTVQTKLTQIKRKQRELGIIAQTRSEKKKETQPITYEMREKMKNGFEVQVVPNTTHRVVGAGIIVVAEGETLEYPLTSYESLNIQQEISNLKTSVLSAINNLESDNRNEMGVLLFDMLKVSAEYAEETNKLPIVKFLSEVLKFIDRDDNVELHEKVIKITEQISDSLYPKVQVPKKVRIMQAKNKEEEFLIEIFNKRTEEKDKRLAVIKKKKKDKLITKNEAVEESGIINQSYMITEDLIQKALYLRHLPQNDYSIEQALFLAAQPISVRYISFKKSNMQFAEKIRETAGKANDLVREFLGQDFITINNVPENDKFILLLPQDLNSPENYWQLRETYPNLVGIITREGLKHYALVAKQGDGFPVLAEAYTMIRDESGASVRVSTLDALKGGELAIIDTGENKVKINPSSDDIKKAFAEQRAEKDKIEYFKNRIFDPVTTQDGIQMSLRVNLDRYEDAERLKEIGIDGIALYRTEYEYERYYDKFKKDILENNLIEIISEDYWVEILEEIITRSQVKSFNVRMPDRQISSDKTEDAKDFEGFGNSNFDGIRFLLNDPIGRKMALTLMKAAMRVYAKHGVIKVFFPMVSTLDDLQRARDIYDEAKEVLVSEGRVAASEIEDFQLGVMFETPGSILASNVLMQYSDFGSVGSNDLITFLSDEQRPSGEHGGRGTVGISKKLTELSPIRSSLNMLLSNAKQQDNYKLTLCGTLASAIDFLFYSANMKATDQGEIIPSVGIGEVAYVKEFIRHIDTKVLAEIFKETDDELLKKELDLEKARINKEIEEKIEEANSDFFKNMLFQNENFIPSVSPPLSENNFIFERSI